MIHLALYHIHCIDTSHLAEIKRGLTTSNYTGTDWIDLGLHLGLLITTLKAIEAEHRGSLFAGVPY